MSESPTQLEIRVAGEKAVAALKELSLAFDLLAETARSATVSTAEFEANWRAVAPFLSPWEPIPVPETLRDFYVALASILGLLILFLWMALP